jgi:hypothetical protein
VFVDVTCFHLSSCGVVHNQWYARLPRSGSHTCRSYFSLAHFSSPLCAKSLHPLAEGLITLPIQPGVTHSPQRLRIVTALILTGRLPPNIFHNLF